VHSCGNSRRCLRSLLAPRGAPPQRTLAQSSCATMRPVLAARRGARRNSSLIRYRVRLADLERHHFEVECRIDGPVAEQRFSLPAWIPGSYLLRDFARHVVQVEAKSGRQPLPVEKVDASTWC